MKKLILSVAVIAVFGFTSCSSDDDGKSCEQLTQEIFVALEAYTQSDTTANCNAYKVAMQAAIDNGCAGSEAYANAIADLDC